MKIVHLTDRVLAGGAERAMVRQINMLTQRYGFEIRVAVTTAVADFSWYYAKHGIEIDVLGVMTRKERSDLSRNLNGLRNLLAGKADFFTSLAALDNYLSREKPDVVHVHFAQSELSAYLYKRFYAPSTTIVNTLHNVDHWKQDPNYYGSAEVFYRVRNHILKSVYGSFDGFVFVSNQLKELHQTRYQIPENQCHVIFNGITLPIRDAVSVESIKKEFSISESDFVLTCVNRVTKLKGTDYLLKAFDRISASIPDAKLLIVGEVKAGEIDPGLCTNKKVIFTGHREDVEGFLDLSDVFVFPSLSEGMPNAVLEAMSHKVAVVATDVGGVSDIIRHKIDGLLIEPRSVEQIVEAVVSLYSDRALLWRLAENGLRRVTRDFKLEQTVDCLRSLYEKVTAQN